jgi:TPR repeat protein
MIMKRTFKAAVAALILAVGFVGSEAAGPAQDALAFQREQAERGDSFAQYLLGLYYWNGVDVPQDYVEAVK